MDFTVAVNPSENKRKRKGKRILGSCQRTKIKRKQKETRKKWNMRVTVVPIVIGEFRKVLKGFEKKRLDELLMGGRNNHLDLNIVKIGLNT